MVNEELLSPAEKLICSLKLKIKHLEQTIDKFKKYDEQRKEYYKDLAIRVGELESELSEYKDSSMGRLMLKIEHQRYELKKLNDKLGVLGCDLPDDLVSAQNEIKTLRAKVEVLNATNKRLKNSLSQLISNNEIN